MTMRDYVFVQAFWTRSVASARVTEGVPINNTHTLSLSMDAETIYITIDNFIQVIQYKII